MKRLRLFFSSRMLVDVTGPSIATSSRNYNQILPDPASAEENLRQSQRDLIFGGVIPSANGDDDVLLAAIGIGHGRAPVVPAGSAVSQTTFPVALSHARNFFPRPARHARQRVAAFTDEQQRPGDQRRRAVRHPNGGSPRSFSSDYAGRRRWRPSTRARHGSCRSR